MSQSIGFGPSRWTRDGVVVIVAVVLALVVELIYFVRVYVPREIAETTHYTGERLLSVCDDRRRTIETWVRGRKAAAELVATHHAIVSLSAPHATAVTGGEDLRDDATSLLDHLVTEYEFQGYEAIYVVSADGVIIAKNSGSAPLDQALLSTTRGSSSSIDFQRDRSGAPVIVVNQTVASTAGAKVIILINPHRWLYPLLRTEPVPTATEETLLVRRDGDSIVALSPLKLNPEPPLTVKRPASTPGLPAAAAIAGKRRFGDYRDYRRVRVLAATTGIAGTRWGLIVKMDRAEALEETKNGIWWVGMATAALTILAAAVALLIWSLFRKKYAVALASSEARFSELFEQANDAVFMFDLDSTIVAANGSAERLYGYSHAELIGMNVERLRPAETRSEIPARRQTILASDGLLFEAVHRTRNGRRIPVEVSARPVANGTLILSIIRDVGERNAAAERIRFLNRMLRTISEINQVVVRDRNNERLLAEACRILVEHGEFLMAWIGFADEETHEVRPVASAGDDSAYISAAVIHFDDGERGRGPVGTAIRENRPVVINDWTTDGSASPSRTVGLERGFRAAAAFPLRVRGQVIGAMAVYGGAPGVFTDEITSLLLQLAGDIAFALDTLEIDRQRKRAEAEVQAASERLQSLFRNMQEGMAYCRMLFIDGEPHDFIYLSVNDAFSRLTGLNNVEGRWVSEVIPGIRESDPEVFQIYGRVAMTGVPEKFEMYIKGLELWFSLSVYRPEAECFVAVFDVITERKKAEAVLRATEQRFRIFFEQSPVGLSLTAPDGRLQRVNQAFCDLVGYTPDELATLPFESITHPDDAVTSSEGAKELLAGKRETWSMEKRYFTKDRRVVWARVETNLARDDEGNPLYFLTHAFDITERRRTDAALRESEERLRLALEAARMGTFDWDVPDDRIVWSRLHEELWGFAPDEFDGRFESFSSRIHSDDRPGVADAMDRSIESREAFTHEFRVVWPDHSIHWVAFSGRFTFGQDGPEHMHGVAREITARKRSEDEIRRLHEELQMHAAELEQRVHDRTVQLEAANRELEAFSYSVSHDLRAPLRAIDGFSRIVEEDYGPGLDDEGRRVIGVIRQNTKQMGQLIDDLLMFSRTGRHALDPKGIDMAAMAMAVFHEIVPKGEQSRYDFQCRPLPHFVGDASLVRQVWANLIGNAVKFTGRTDHPAISISAHRQDHEVVFEVADNGAGFDMRYAEKLFSVFQRLHSLEDFEGTGVGLALVQRIVSRHGGRVWARGAPGQGAVFSFAFPIVEVTHE